MPLTRVVTRSRRRSAQNPRSRRHRTARLSRTRRRDPRDPISSLAIAAIRTLPFGGMDDSTRDLSLPPAVRAAVSPAVAALRWGSIGFGMVFAAPQAFRGSYAAVVSLAVCLFVTTWRTTLPIRLGGTSTPAADRPDGRHRDPRRRGRIRRRPRELVDLLRDRGGRRRRVRLGTGPWAHRARDLDWSRSSSVSRSVKPRSASRSTTPATSPSSP